MKGRYPALLGALLAFGVLVWLFGWCGGGGGGEAISEHVRDVFPTQYPISTTIPVGRNTTIEEDKLADFDFYKTSGISFSRAEIFTRDLLSDSVKKNAEIKGYGDTIQKYNYVINSHGDILVAVWDNVDATDVRALLTDRICQARNTMFPLEDVISEGTMINFSNETSSTTPCQLNRGGNLLDGLSKHFMLAQGPGSRIKDYEKMDWADTKVFYAGEMTVTVEGCTFWISNNSGTYTPTYDATIAGQLVTYFSKYEPLKIPPIAVALGTRTPSPTTTPVDDKYKIPDC